MPITKEKKKIYGDGWKLLSLKLIEERANNCCEKCGAAKKLPETKNGKRVTLSVAHLDHNEKNNSLSNLLVMCGACHLRYDMKDNLKRRMRKKYYIDPNQLLLFSFALLHLFSLPIF